MNSLLSFRSTTNPTACLVQMCLRFTVLTTIYTYPYTYFPSRLPFLLTKWNFSNFLKKNARQNKSIVLSYNMNVNLLSLVFRTQNHGVRILKQVEAGDHSEAMTEKTFLTCCLCLSLQWELVCYFSFKKIGLDSVLLQQINHKSSTNSGTQFYSKCSLKYKNRKLQKTYKYSAS